MEDFTQDDLVDFQRAFQMQTKIESSPSFRDGDAEKLLRKVNLKLDDDKKRFINNQVGWPNFVHLFIMHKSDVIVFN